MPFVKEAITRAPQLSFRTLVATLTIVDRLHRKSLDGMRSLRYIGSYATTLLDHAAQRVGAPAGGSGRKLSTTRAGGARGVGVGLAGSYVDAMPTREAMVDADVAAG